MLDFVSQHDQFTVPEELAKNAESFQKKKSVFPLVTPQERSWGFLLLPMLDLGSWTRKLQHREGKGEVHNENISSQKAKAFFPSVWFALFPL